LIINPLEYRKERDREFLLSCEKVRRNTNGYISVRNIVKQAIHTSASSFFISEREFGKIIRDKKNHTPRSKAKAALYTEIRRRYRRLKASFPNIGIESLARRIAYQEAPRFYITEESAKNLYYRLLKNKKK
jgi:hypothetical protein